MCVVCVWLTGERVVAAEELVENLVRIAAERVRVAPRVEIERHAVLQTLFAKLIVNGLFPCYKNTENTSG